MKNVTISLEERLLDAAREHARRQGSSFNEWVRSLLRRELEGSPAEGLNAAWERADADGLRLGGTMPDREERNAR